MAKLNSMRVLDQARIRYSARHFVAEHISAVEVAEQLGVDPAMVYKTLVALPAGGKPVLVMLAAPDTLDLKALARMLGVKQVAMASLAEAESLTGLLAGGIGALALRHKGWRCFLDRAALTAPGGRILVSAGQRGLNLEVAVTDLIGVLKPEVGDFSRASVEP